MGLQERDREIMKKNLFLCLVFFSLVGIAYYLEEVKKPNQRRQNENKRRILPEETELQRVILPNLELLKNERNQWIIKDQKRIADPDVVNKLITVLKGLVKIKELPLEKEGEFFDQQASRIIFNLPEQKLNIELGKFLVASGRFALKINDEIYLCEDESLYQQIYQSEKEKQAKKYLFLRSMLLDSSWAYTERSFFKNKDLQNLKRVKVDNKRNRWFQLDIQKQTTTPAPFNDIKLKNLSALILEKLSRVRIKREIESTQNILTEFTSEILIEGQSDLRVRLYQNLNGQYGKFLKKNDELKIVEIEDQGSEIFFGNVQNYWLKQFPLTRQTQGNSLKFEVSKNGVDYFAFNITALDKFSIEPPKNLSINRQVVNLVFNILFNLLDFREADFISKMDGISQDVRPELYVKVEGHIYAFIVDGHYLKVQDETTGLEYNFRNVNQFIKKGIFKDFYSKQKGNS